MLRTEETPTTDCTDKKRIKPKPISSVEVDTANQPVSAILTVRSAPVWIGVRFLSVFNPRKPGVDSLSFAREFVLEDTESVYLYLDAVAGLNGSYS